jgi:hypothetical protein
MNNNETNEEPMGWIVIGKYEQMNEDAIAEVKRWSDVAFDVGFIPERVVKVEQDKDEVRVLIDQDLYGYFRQGL